MSYIINRVVVNGPRNVVIKHSLAFDLIAFFVLVLIFCDAQLTLKTNHLLVQYV